MAAFDLNSLYFLKNAAPQTTSFEEAYAPVEKGFNLGRAYNENYNKNSLQNLIAQREKEGVPYDRLSNEAAKWDLGAANNMRDERRESMEYNYKQSMAEFEQWRMNMARRICGLILQKADELGIAPEELDRVLNVAASYVVTYDEALAQWLLGQAMARRNAITRANNQKPINDHEKEISNLTKITINKDETPANFAEMTGQQHAAQAVLRYKNATGNNIWLRQVQYLLNEAKQRFPKYLNAGSDLNEMRAWLDGLSQEDVVAMVGNVEGGDASEMSGLTVSTEQTVPPMNGNANGKSSGGASGVGSSASEEAPEIIGMDIGSRKKKINENAVERLEAFIDRNSENKAALMSARKKLTKGMTWAEGNSGGSENAALKSLLDKVDANLEKIAELEKGGFTPETAKVLKLNDKSGAERTAEVARWQRIPTIVNGFYTAAGALLPPLVRALLPEERTTDQDVARVLVTNLGEDGFDKLRNAIASSDNKTLGSLLKQKAFEQAVRNVAPIVMDKIKGEYEALVSVNGKEKVDSALKEAYNFNDKVIKYLDGTYELQTDKKRYEQIQKKQTEEKQQKEAAAFEREMGNDEGAISASEWLRRRREGK